MHTALTIDCDGIFLCTCLFPRSLNRARLRRAGADDGIGNRVGETARLILGLEEEGGDDAVSTRGPLAVARAVTSRVALNAPEWALPVLENALPTKEW